MNEAFLWDAPRSSRSHVDTTGETEIEPAPVSGTVVKRARVEAASEEVEETPATDPRVAVLRAEVARLDGEREAAEQRARRAEHRAQLVTEWSPPLSPTNAPALALLGAAAEDILARSSLRPVVERAMPLLRRGALAIARRFSLA